MMNNADDKVTGCENCWPATAEAAWKARCQLGHTKELIDESHYHVMIMACAQCGQKYLSVFTEMIDWQEGDDAQYWTSVPVTESEATNLAQRGAELTEDEINETGASKQALCRDYPTGGNPAVYWGKGITVGPHD